MVRRCSPKAKIAGSIPASVEIFALFFSTSTEKPHIPRLISEDQSWRFSLNQIAIWKEDPDDLLRISV
jgi:hypothetical protein